MKITIIIPTYNYGHYLIQAIESVKVQQDNNIELIIVDDGSTDNTAAIIKHYQDSAQQPIKYIQQANQGPTAARNHGARLATGDYLLFLDADDRLLPDALAKFRQCLQQYPNIDFIGVGHLSSEPDQTIRLHLFTKPLTNDRFTNFKGYLLKKYSLVNSASLFHRVLFNTLQFPEQLRNSEDIVLFAQILALFNCRSLIDPVVIMYKHADSLRHQMEYSKTINTEIVDILFDSRILPEKFLAFRQTYYARRCLSLSRSFYLAGDYKAARLFYQQAIKAEPACLLQFSYLKKYLASLVAT